MSYDQQLADAVKMIVELEAQCAAMRQWLKELDYLHGFSGYEQDTTEYAVSTFLRTGSNAGSQLLERVSELESLVDRIEQEPCGKCNYYRSIHTPCKCGQLSVIGTNARLRQERDALREAGGNVAKHLFLCLECFDPAEYDKSARVALSKWEELTK